MSIVNDTYSIVAGDTAPAWNFPITPRTGTFDTTGLSASNFTMKLINLENADVIVATGTFSNPVAANGSTPASISFSPSDADVATPGDYLMRIVCTYTNGKKTTIKPLYKLHIEA